MLEGSFDERFLRLPERVIVTAMQSHQRYFPLGGNRFAFVANGGDPEVVRAGNERVLEGAARRRELHVRPRRRRRDRRARRAARRDHVLRGRRHVRRQDGAARGARRASSAAARRRARRRGWRRPTRRRSSCASSPSSRAYIGAEYARLAGYPEAVCAAIEEQYLPDAADAPLPETEAGRVLAAADKIDTLTVSFSLGHRPTGSRDPYGLRRAAIGLCRLAVEGGLTVPRSPARPARCASSSRSGSRACSTCRSSSCARRARRRHPTWAAWPARAGAVRRAGVAGVRRGLHRVRARAPAGGAERPTTPRPRSIARLLQGGRGARPGGRARDRSRSTETCGERSSRARRWRR